MMGNIITISMSLDQKKTKNNGVKEEKENTTGEKGTKYLQNK